MSAQVVTRVVNSAGLAFNVRLVRLVRKGDHYGLNDCLVHEDDQPMIEFWDSTYEHDPRFTPGLGQFVSRYLLDTLTGREGSSLRRYGLDLCGHVAAWKLTAGNITDAIAAASAALAQGAN